MMEINCTGDEDVGLSSLVIEQVPNASIIIECSDSPTTSKEILSQEKCFSLPSMPINPNPMKEYQQPLTAHAKVFHNNHYEDTVASRRPPC